MTQTIISNSTVTVRSIETGGMPLMAAHHQWASRPNDQRFTTLDDLYAYTKGIQEASAQIVMPVSKLTMGAKESEVLLNGVPLTWSAFGRLAALAGAPAKYLRTLPASLVAQNLQHGIEEMQAAMVREQAEEDGKPLAAPSGAAASEAMIKLMAIKPGELGNPDGRIAALTSTSYGRIWDWQVVKAVMDMNARHNDMWRVPSAAYGGQITKQSTTLYASDHDVFLFLVDGERNVGLDGDPVNRGFIVSNTQTYGHSLKVLSFLFKYVCGNRMIWGPKEIKQLRLRHTSNGPEMFRTEVPRILSQYTEASAQPILEMTEAAQKLLPAKVEFNPMVSLEERGKQREPVISWLRGRNFKQHEAEGSLKVVEEENPDTGIAPSANPYSLYNLVQGLTYYAREIEYAEARVDLEERAGKLIELAKSEYSLN